MAGFSTRYGIHDEAQRKRIADIIQQVETDGIRTVRLGFADQHGVVRGKSFAACLLYTSPSPRDGLLSRMPSSA